MAKKKKIITESTGLSKKIADLMESGGTASDVYDLVKQSVNEITDGFKVSGMGTLESHEIRTASAQLEADRAALDEL
jgi:hypothetical protein